MEHEHTEHVAAPAESVYAALADVSNLPLYVPQMTSATAGADGTVEVEARYEGHTQRGSASFNADAERRRIEWSAGGGYHGWMQVDPDGDGSRLTLFLATVHGDAPDREVVGTLDAIRRLVEAKV